MTAKPPTPDQVAAALAAMTPEERQLTLTKAALALPMTAGPKHYRKAK